MGEWVERVGGWVGRRVVLGVLVLVMVVGALVLVAVGAVGAAVMVALVVASEIFHREAWSGPAQERARDDTPYCY